MDVLVVQGGQDPAADGKKTRKLIRRLFAQLEETIMTNAQRLTASVEDLASDVAYLKDQATVRADADAATIAQLRTDVEAATAQKGVDDATIADLTAAVDTAEASLASAAADFDAGLGPIADRAAEVAGQTDSSPAPVEPPVEEPPVEEPPVTPEEPAPPVDEEPPVVGEPDPIEPPVEEPAPTEPAPVDDVPRDDLGNPIQ